MIHLVRTGEKKMQTINNRMAAIKRAETKGDDLLNSLLDAGNRIVSRQTPCEVGRTSFGWTLH